MTNHRRQRGPAEVQGAAVVEMAMLFPLSFLILMLVMQTALNLTFRLYCDTVSRQALLCAAQARRSGDSMDEAAETGDSWLQETLASVPGLSCSSEWEEKEGFLEESFSLSVSGSYRFLLPVSWEQTYAAASMDPADFRNRVDLVKEVLKGDDGE